MSKKVIVIGGGIAGMSAAHELAERGFEVEIFDKHRLYVGGKARSVNVPSSNLLNAQKHLPGEHGFRFFPGFYTHIVDTMKRIPYGNQPQGVFDNLVEVDHVGIYQAGKRGIFAIVNFPKSFDDVKSTIDTLHADTGLTSEEKQFFAKKIWQLMTTCYDRRLSEYEKIGWWEFMEADRFSDTYRALLVQGITRTLVAANAKKASTRTDGDILLQLLFNMTNPGKHTDRVFNGPTNDVWLTPWLTYLQEKGVKYTFNHTAKKLEIANGSITGVWVETHNNGKPEKTLATADYYILAVPIEVAAELISEDILKSDPSLENIIRLAPSVAWMNGIQLYLSEVIDVVHGHCLYADSPWALTSISQLQFWKDYDMEDRYNGKVKSILSVDISNWEDDGLLDYEVTDSNTGGTLKVKKQARHCTYEEIKNEVWAQLKASINVDGKVILRDEHLIHWYIDHDITVSKQGDDKNKEPLLVNTVDSWRLRPEVNTKIPNLFLASDYVRTYTDLATMEGANEAARRAVNFIIDASGVKAKKCQLWNLHEPELLKPMRNSDQKNYDKGLPYQFHLPYLLRFIGQFIKFIMILFRD
jgi:uncharacterized protein with NAD-binding domain and iron-sulfur cluster